MSEPTERWRRAAACVDASGPDRFVAPSTASRDAALLVAEFCVGGPVAQCRRFSIGVGCAGVCGRGR
ncbi:MAG: hypothetical protein ACRDT0_07215 [Pseudonocardiaceae bacterium]